MRSLRERLSQFDRAPSVAPRTDFAPSDPAVLATRLGFSIVGPGHWLRSESLSLGMSRDGAIARRLAGWDQLPRGPWAILDTETTGLEGGAGTLVFLVAILRVEGDVARLRQHFLADLVGESSLLDAVGTELSSCGLLLSYNGKSFDLPRLRSRMALHRLAVEGLDAPHLDLVHPLRRLGRGWLTDARLSTVERELLGIERVDDLPGALVPAVYRDWLQQGDCGRLEAVMLHNRLDVVHLAGLWDRLGSWFSAPHREGLPAPLRLGLGRILEQRGQVEDALRCYRRAAESEDPECRRRALWRWARIARRRRDDETARSLWERLLGEHPTWIAPRIELAKLFEHRLRNLELAREHTETALAMLVSDESASVESRRTERARLLHRLARLQAKSARGSVA